MKKTIGILICIVIINGACNNDEIDRDKNNNSTNTDVKENNDTTTKTNFNKIERYVAELDTTVYRKDYALEKTFKHYFSSNNTKDEFNITIRGKHIYSSEVYFTITNSNGTIIYTDKFKAMKVLENVFDGGGEYATFIEQDEYLKNWLSNFLTNEKFLTPAILQERTFYAEHSNQQIWNEIADENTIGFLYSKTKGSQTEIAFNKTQNKVTVYYEY